MTAAATHALAVLAPLATLFLLVSYLRHHEFAVDFEHEYWVAAHRVLAGHDPYAWPQGSIDIGVAFPYPPLTAVLLVPFGLIPTGMSAGLFVALLMVCAAATLWVLSVRDWRVYALTFLLWPVISAWQAGNLTLLLGLLIALTWRYRHKPVVAGLLVALTLSLKQFTWPIGLWLLATRRFRAAGWALAGGLASNLIALALLGPAALGRYLHLAGDVSSTLYRSGYSVMAIAARMGVGHAAAFDLLIACSAALGLLCLRLGRRRHDDAALAVTVALMLAASPLLWNHYFALLIVPLAIARPRLSAEWIAALVLWLCPALHVTEWQALLAAFTTGWIVVRITRVQLASTAGTMDRLVFGTQSSGGPAGLTSWPAPSSPSASATREPSGKVRPASSSSSGTSTNRREVTSG